MIIAIDGPSAAGKGTLSKGVADRLGLIWIDTGATYRLVALRHLAQSQDPLLCAQWVYDHTTLPDLADPALRSRDAGAFASKMAATPGVRPLMVSLMRKLARESEKGAVLDGRDIGTDVFPDADAKLYVTASDEIRAHRRVKELQLNGFDVTYEAVLSDLRERDARDMNRKDAPLRQAEDAILIDTGDLSPEQMVDKALHLITDQQKA